MANELANRMGVQPQNFLTYPPMNYAPPLSQVAPQAETSTMYPGSILRLLDLVTGGNRSPMVARAPANQAYPSSNDLYYAQAYDQTYGTPMAGFTVPGAKMAQLDWHNDVVGRATNDIVNRAAKTTPTEIPSAARDELIKNWLAAQKSAVSALGYDPRAIARTQNQG